MNKAIFGVAGSGKTTSVIKDILSYCDKKNVVIISYTNRAVNSIIEKIKTNNGGILSSNITVISWYGFIYKECVLPYQKNMFEGLELKGINFVTKKNFYISKVECSRYVDKNGKIYHDRISEFIWESLKNDNSIINRLCEIFDSIVIDEVQDLSGRDIDFVDKIINDGRINITLIGDHRQATFSTHQTNCNKKNGGKNIYEHLVNLEKDGKIVVCKNNDCYRSNQDICAFANLFFPEMDKAESKFCSITGHDGVFLILKKDLDLYISFLKSYNSNIQYLKYDKKTKTFFSTMNFGECKALTFDRVVIFPNRKMIDFLYSLYLESPSKYYIAVTRARHSVSIVVDDFEISNSYKDEEIKFENKEFVIKKFVKSND